MRLKLLCTAVLLTVCAGGTLRAEIINQIPAPFSETSYMGSTTALSQYDTGLVTPPNLRNIGTTFDNFTFSTTGVVDNIAWVGAYDTNDFSGATFQISLYDNIGSDPNNLPAPLQQFSVGNANETAVGGFNGYYSYSTSLAPFSVTAGQTYWVSIVAQLDYNDAGWGVSFSNLGDNNSFQDFGDTSLERFNDPVDYAIRVSAVPEPGSLMGLLAVAGAAGFWRRRAV